MTKTMQTLTTASVLALALAGAAIAQTAPTTPPVGAPATTGSIGKADPAHEAKWNALDKDNKGVLEGAALDSLKPVMGQVDANKDGKVSKDEFMAAAKAGIVK